MAEKAGTNRIAKPITHSKKYNLPRRQPLHHQNDEPVLLTKFSTFAVSQKSSRLLCLPAELRIEVLRLLLRSRNKDGVIAPWSQIDALRHDTTSRERFSQRPNLCAQILVSCQQLCAEGRHVLYKENTLGVHISLYGSTYVWDYRVDLPRKIGQLTSREQSLWTTIERKTIEKRDESYDKHKSFDLYTAMSQFDRFSMEIDVRDQESIYVACRLWCNLLCGKSTTMIITRHEQPVPAAWLKACRMLRCKSLELPGHNQTLIRATQRIVQSNKPVTDMYDLLQDCFAVLKKVHLVKPFVPKPEMHHCGKLLISAAIDHSAIRVAKYKPRFNKAAEEAINTWAEGRREKLKRELEELEEKEREMLRVVGKVRE